MFRNIFRKFKSRRRKRQLLFTILVSRSYPEAPVQAASPKQLTSPERRSKMSATELHMTTDASTKLFTKRYCCLRELPNEFAKDRYYGTLRRKKRPAKTVRPRGALMPHFRENYPGTNKSTLCGISLRRISHHTECVSILRFTTRMMEIPMCIFYCRPAA